MPDQPIRIYRKRWVALYRVIFASVLMAWFGNMLKYAVLQGMGITEWPMLAFLIFVCLLSAIFALRSIIELLRIRPLVIFSEAGFYKLMSFQMRPVPWSQIQGVKLQAYKYGHPFMAGFWREKPMPLESFSRLDPGFLHGWRKLSLEVYSPFLQAYFHDWSLISLVGTNTAQVRMEFVDGDPSETLKRVLELQKAIRGHRAEPD